METPNLIQQFYEAFQAGKPEAMTQLYHQNIQFSDPAFGTLEGERAKAMWRMLLKRSKGQLKVSFGEVIETPIYGSAKWIAHYPYGPNKRPVTNYVFAKFKMKDGKIIEHMDDFNLYEWSKQALGLPGYLLGWSRFMRTKIQLKTNKLLDSFMAKESNDA